MLKKLNSGQAFHTLCSCTWFSPGDWWSVSLVQSILGTVAGYQGKQGLMDFWEFRSRIGATTHHQKGHGNVASQTLRRGSHLIHSQWLVDRFGPRMACQNEFSGCQSQVSSGHNDSCPKFSHVFLGLCQVYPTWLKIRLQRWSVKNKWKNIKMCKKWRENPGWPRGRQNWFYFQMRFSRQISSQSSREKED